MFVSMKRQKFMISCIAKMLLVKEFAFCLQNNRKFILSQADVDHPFNLQTYII